MALGAARSSPLHVAVAADVVAGVSAVLAGAADVVSSGLAAAGGDAAVAAVVPGAAAAGTVASASVLAGGAPGVSVGAAPSVVVAAGVLGLAALAWSGARSLFIIVVTRMAFCRWAKGGPLLLCKRPLECPLTLSLWGRRVTLPFALLLPFKA